MGGRRIIEVIHNHMATDFNNTKNIEEEETNDELLVGSDGDEGGEQFEQEDLENNEGSENMEEEEDNGGDDDDDDKEQMKSEEIDSSQTQTSSLVESKTEISSSTAIATAIIPSTTTPQPTTSALVLVPSLRGKYETLGSMVICKGRWAMSDAGHSTPDQTSPFEFKLVKALDGSMTYPVSGKYQGWFLLKQTPSKATKVDDKDMTIKFIRNDDNNSGSDENNNSGGGGNYKVEGKGVNRYGSFILYGTFVAASGEIQLYREYLPKALPGPKRSTSNEIKVKSTAHIDESVQREGSGRVRKVSSFMKEYEDSLAPKPKLVSSSSSSVTKPALQHSTSSSYSSSTNQIYSTSQLLSSNAAAAGGGGRSQRLPTAMVKCSELLKEIMKHPQAVWFLEPVDPIKLGIPDYLTIITKPMDFGTISRNIEKGVYDSPEQFAEHMRLVFRNAITYNQMRDHPVHVAARELNAKFEDRFRVLLSTISTMLLGPAALAAGVYQEPKMIRQTSTSSTKKAKGISRTSSSSSSGNLWNKSRPSSVGGGARFDAFLPPVVDASNASLIEMQRKMQEMQEELMALRTTIRQGEVKNTLETQRTAAKDPLSFEEKRLLITQIHKLPGDKMDHVVEIIQAAIKPNQRADNEEIEIPLDELDTLTLRKLQRYVEDCNRPKKRSSAPYVPSRNGSTTIVKKPRIDQQRPQSLVNNGYQDSSYTYDGTDVIESHDYVMEDDLLFDTHLLEEEGVHGSQATSLKPSNMTMTEVNHNQDLHSSSSLNNVDFGDDDLATMLSSHGKSIFTSDSNLHSSSNNHDDGITIINATAWTSSTVSVSHTTSDSNNTNNSSNNILRSSSKDDVWGAVAAELKAKEVREQQRKDELERQTHLRAQQEAERIENLKRIAHHELSQLRSEEERQEQQKLKEEGRLARELQQQKEEERRHREAEAAAAAASTDTLAAVDSMMMLLGDDDDDDNQE